MELNDYSVLGIEEKNCTFSIIKCAYHDLARIYHPDSNYCNRLSKEEKEIAFQKIQNAYNTLKEKYFVNEVDLPENEIEYENFNLAKDENITDLKSFNAEFEKKHNKQNYDNPYSISYQENNIKHRTINPEKNTQLSIITPIFDNKNTSELGINYVSDFSDNNSMDLRYLRYLRSKDLKDSKKQKIESIKEVTLSVSETNDKMNELIMQREKTLKLTEKDKEQEELFIQATNNFEKLRIKVHNKRVKNYIQ